MATARVGTSGWSYRNWRGPFYPRGLPTGQWLGFLATRLSTVEINASFYRPQPPERLAGWATATPRGFRFAVKAWRALTHYHRLAQCGELAQAFLQGLAPLGGKLGPVLFQLPPRFPADPAVLDRFLAMLPDCHRYAIEFRDRSWWGDETAEVLARHRAIFCVFELAGLRSPRLVTTDAVYLRLHGAEQRYRGAYGEAGLLDWAGWLSDQLARGRDVWAYFDNTDEADHAVCDALILQRLLDAHSPPTNHQPH